MQGRLLTWPYRCGSREILLLQRSEDEGRDTGAAYRVTHRQHNRGDHSVGESEQTGRRLLSKLVNLHFAIAPLRA
jgi:hypothetical protein